MIKVAKKGYMWDQFQKRFSTLSFMVEGSIFFKWLSLSQPYGNLSFF